MSDAPTPVPLDRATNALLAHACGDAFGAPLEFISVPAVRAAPTSIGRWTDDTHMALYLGAAVLDHGSGLLDADRFGTAVGTAFLRWLDDPLTPSTAPGTTCLSGARRFASCRDWRTSGVPSGDGCGAVMRIGPLAIAFSDEALTEAADISARVTHAHPDAREAAIAGAQLTRMALEAGDLTPAMVQAVILRLRGDWGRGGKVAESLSAALRLAAAGGEWLDEAAIPPGDGGWKAASALGLAVAAALRWGRSVEVAVEKAARIGGDSDSVASITGLLLGAAGRPVPPGWLRALPEADRIRRLAADLHALSLPTPRAAIPARVPAPTPARPPSAPAPALVSRLAPSPVPARTDLPLVVVADLHGRPDLFAALVHRLDVEIGRYRLVTLGDYTDNGPDIAPLIDRMIALRAERPDTFHPILGNHDLACLRALGFPGEATDPRWFQEWRHYWDDGLSTPARYGASDLDGFARAMPLAHYRFLAGLPWCYDDGRFLCVHAGMQPGPLGPQRDRLLRRELPAAHLELPPQLRDKSLSRTNDPGWERVVISGHTKLGGEAVYAASHRRCLSGEVDRTGRLFALIPASGAVFAASRSGVEQLASIRPA